MCAIAAPFALLALGAMAGFICLYSSQVMSPERDRLCMKYIVPPFAIGKATLTRKDVSLFNEPTQRQRHPSYLGSSDNPIAPTHLLLQEYECTHPYTQLLCNTFHYEYTPDFLVDGTVVHPRQSDNIIAKSVTYSRQSDLFVAKSVNELNGTGSVKDNAHTVAEHQATVNLTMATSNPTVESKSDSDSSSGDTTLAPIIQPPSPSATITIASMTSTDTNGFLTTPRSLNDVVPGLRTLRTVRASMDAKETEKCRQSVVVALTPLFAHILPSKGLAILQEAHSVHMRTHAFVTRITGYSIQEVFLIRTDFASDGSLNGDGKPVNLLTDHNQLSVDQIRKSNLFYRIFGANATYGQDIDWSEALLESSCETSLRDQVIERVADIPALERGGPLFFKIMMEVMTTTSDESIETMISTLRGLSLLDDAFKGEDVDMINSLIRGGLSRLKLLDSVPKDMFSVVCRIYQTSTTPDFCQKFHFINTANQFSMGNSMELSTLLQTGENEYRTLHARNLWAAAVGPRKGKESAFMGSTDQICCHRCGELGHYAKECLAAKPKGYSAETGKITDTGNGGNGTGTVKVNPNRIPPKEGDNHKKDFQINGNTVNKSWCSKCGLWNNTHLTKDHKSKKTSPAVPPTPTPPAEAPAPFIGMASAAHPGVEAAARMADLFGA